MLYSKLLQHVGPSCGFSALVTFREHDGIIRRKRHISFLSSEIFVIIAKARLLLARMESFWDYPGTVNMCIPQSKY